MQTYRLSLLSIVILSAAGIALALLTSVALRKTAQTSPNVQPPQEYQPIRAPDASKKVYDNRYSASRPLFMQERRALAAVAPVEEGVNANSTDTGSMRMEAIIGGKQGLSAGLRLADGQPLMWVRKGQNIHDWTVSKISFETVHLQKDTDEQVLHLYPVRQRSPGE